MLDDNKISIDLHGMRANEAKIAIEQHLINCLNNNLSQIRIVHGHGEGVLKKITQETLDKSEFVKRYYYDHNYSATIGELKY